jgi:PAS domain S-box-containing protein
MKSASILIVEDEAIVAKSIEKRLISLGYSVAGSVATGIEALQVVARIRPDLILLDIRLKGTLDGIGVARIIRDWYGIPVIFVTAFADRETIERASETGPYGYLIKPFGEKDLLSAIAVAQSRIEQENSGANGSSSVDARYKNTVNNASAAIAVINPDKKIIMANTAFELLTGYSCTDLAGVSNLNSLFDENDKEKVSDYQCNFQSDSTGMPAGINVRIRTVASEHIPVTLRLGRIEGTLLVTASFQVVPSESSTG